jgi:hypothetical protein
VKTSQAAAACAKAEQFFAALFTGPFPLHEDCGQTSPGGCFSSIIPLANFWLRRVKGVFHAPKSGSAF